MDPRDVLRSLRNRHDGAKPREWYSIRNLAAGEAEIFIYDVIGESWFGGITAGQFVSDLRAVQANKILLRINSPGGDIFDAVAIRNALLQHPATVESHIDGIAASSASWVALQDRVIMSPHATMMIHEPFNFVGGDAAYLRQQADVLDLFGGQIADMYVEKAGGKPEAWRDLMRAETWYTDQQAVDAGLADEISGEAPAAANRYDPAILNLFKHTPASLAAPPAPAPVANTQPDPALVSAVLEYHRDQSRRLGVA